MILDVDCAVDLLDALLVADESFAVKNPQARRTQALVSIRDWFARGLATAWYTPYDILAQVSMVDFGTTFAEVNIPKDRAEAMPVVRETLDTRAVYLRNLKVDVLLDLPERPSTRLTGPLALVQTQLYTGRPRDLIKEVEALDDEQFLK